MKVDWLIDCEPRPVQIEALRRSYHGLATQTKVDGEKFTKYLPHHGGPAKGWAHFMEMRLGKTPVTLAEFELFRRDYGFKRLAILSPNSFKKTWGQEIDKFGVLLPSHVFESKRRADAYQWCENHDEGVFVINYEALRQTQTQHLLESWVDNKTMLVADESVLIKNYTAVMTKAALKLSKKAGAVRILTGQPCPQGVHDLYSQLRFVGQLERVNFYGFRNRFALMGGWQGKQVVGVKNRDQLSELLGKISFVAKRRNWAVTNEPDYETVRLEMSKIQRQHYQSMDRELIVFLDEQEDAISADQAGAKWAKLQQISSGFIYNDRGDVQLLLPFHKTHKFMDLEQRLQFISGKVLIMAHHAATVRLLYEHLPDSAIIASGLTMKNLGKNVEDEKTRFNSDDSCKIMVAQVKAVKYGHTLLGTPNEPCDTTIYFENSFSLDDRIQSEQRNQTVAKSDPIHIIDYVSGEAEKRVIDRLQRKQQIAELITRQEEENV